MLQVFIWILHSCSCYTHKLQAYIVNILPVFQMCIAEMRHVAISGCMQRRSPWVQWSSRAAAATHSYIRRCTPTCGGGCACVTIACGMRGWLCRCSCHMWDKRARLSNIRSRRDGHGLLDKSGRRALATFKWTLTWRGVCICDSLPILIHRTLTEWQV
jgi:hypothetical protein